MVDFSYVRIEALLQVHFDVLLSLGSFFHDDLSGRQVRVELVKTVL